MRVLVVEDDVGIASFVKKGLREAAFAVDWAANGIDGAHLAATEHYDLMVLDLMLPGLDGLSILRKVRAQGIQTPIICLTARDSVEDRVQGLNLGADDYITKPFDLDEFLARVNAVLRRSRPSADDLVLGAIRIDFISHTAKRGDSDIHLTHREFELLKYLAERPGRVVGREELLKELWEYPDAALTRSVDHAIARLRRKVEADPQQPRFIHTAVGFGYSLTPDGSGSP